MKGLLLVLLLLLAGCSGPVYCSVPRIESMEDLDKACEEWHLDNFPSWRAGYGYAGVQPAEVLNRGGLPLYRPITGPHTRPYYGWP